MAAILRLFSLFLLIWVHTAVSLENGLARTPPMGFNTWNAYRDIINENVIRSTVDLMVDLGLVEAGYTYINLDDGWSTRTRSSSTGLLEADPEKFPSGINALVDYVHSKGLKVGIYSDAGTKTCAGYPASLGYEVTDAQTFASWGIDLLKYDNCYAPPTEKQSVRERYEVMGDALAASGRPILYSMCEWGVSSPWTYSSTLGNTWRTSGDISFKLEAEWNNIMQNLDSLSGISRFAGPGGWNDADMLEIGLPGSAGLSIGEQRAHFALWAIAKSPLFLGCFLNQLKPEELAILKAKEVIAVHQDPLGVAGDVVWKQGPKEVWAAPLEGGDRAVVLLSQHVVSDYLFPDANITVSWVHLGFPPGTQVSVRDLFAEKDLGKFTDRFTTAVPNHGVVALRVTPLNMDSTAYQGWRPWHCGIATNNVEEAWVCPAALPGSSCEYWTNSSLATCCPGLSSKVITYLTGTVTGVLVALLFILGRQYVQKRRTNGNYPGVQLSSLPSTHGI